MIIVTRSVGVASTTVLGHVGHVPAGRYKDMQERVILVVFCFMFIIARLTEIISSLRSPCKWDNFNSASKGLKLFR